MAPVPPALAFLFGRSPANSEELAISDLSVSSLELDKRTALTTPASDSLLVSTLHTRDVQSEPASPMEAHDLGKRTTGIYQRDTNTKYQPGVGSKPATDFSGPGYLALFALIGTGMVVASIWFFFWAKNGGFKFQEGDWDDYKSTVLRRKGPDGKTLSNATKSTKLGGGSIVHGQDYQREKWIAKSVVGTDEKGRRGIRAKRGFAKTHSVWGGDDDYMTESWGTQTVSDETMTEARTEANYTDHSKRYRDRDVHHYKREKPARVGGINRVADGSSYTNTDRSDTYTENSEQPMIQKQKKDKHHRTPQEEAERRAKIEAKKMERRWKQEAEEAAAALARENARPPPPKLAPSPTKPSPQKQRERRNSRSASPKKRDFSYNAGGSEVLSTTYTASESDRTHNTGSSGNTKRTASYYDAYRPRNTADGKSRSRQSSPKKGGRREGGYRRGADSDLD